MPIEIKESIRPFDQARFGTVAHEVMAHAFNIHNEMGRLFRKENYQSELARRLGTRATEVEIVVTFDTFAKQYYLDLVVDQGAVFELKTVDRLGNKHRAQLLNYLLLTELHHGKLINFRPDRVEHEFVNTTLTHKGRTSFDVIDSDWTGSGKLRDWIVSALRDWGTGLDIDLYEEAFTHFLGGPEAVLTEIDVVKDGRRIGTTESPTCR